MKTDTGKETGLDIAETVENARNGSRSSFQELVGLFQEDIYRLAYYKTFSQMDAEDLTQDVFELAYRKLSTLKEPQSFRAWLYSIAVNRCNDFLRKRKYLGLLYNRSLEEEEMTDRGKYTNSSQADRIDRKTFWKKVKTMLSRLSAMEREVFTLRFMDHRNINEIAAILNKNESTIKTHLYRSLAKLRAHADFFQEHRETIS